MSELAKTNWRIVPTAYFDLETTGLDHDEARIIQFGGICCYMNQQEQQVIERIDLLINPQMEVEDKIWEITKLDPESVYSAPTWEEQLPKIQDFFSKAVMYSGYNIIKYDMPVLQNHYNRSGLALPRKYVFDLVFWYRHYTNRMSRAKLSDAAKAFGARKFAEASHGMGNLHNASVDAELVADLALKMAQRNITSWTLGDLMKDQKQIVEKQLEYLHKRYGDEPYFDRFITQDEVDNYFASREEE